jgi:O-antigen/teichoic acid export membrane protein
MTSLTRTATTAATWSALEIICRIGVQFVVTVIFARLLAPEDFGTLSILLIFTTLGAVFVDAGFGVALIQRRTPTADECFTVFAFSSAMGILLATLLAVSAPIVAHFFDQPALAPLLTFVALVLPLGGLAAVPDAILSTRLDFRSRTLCQLVASLGSGALGISLAMLGFGVWSLAWQVVIAAAIRTTALWAISGVRPIGRVRMDAIRSLGGFGGYMLISSLFDTAFSRLQWALIGKVSNTTSLGYYVVADTTQQAPASFINAVLNRVGLPVFATISNDQVKLRAALRMTLQVAMFLFVPAMVGIALVAEPLVRSLYGEQWLQAAPFLTILALGTSLWPMHILNLAAITAQGRSDLFLRLELWKKIASLILLCVGSYWGALGVAWSMLVANALSAAINTYYSGTMLGYGVVAQLKDQRATFTLSTASAAAGWAVLHWTLPGIFPTIVAIVLAIFIYTTGAILANTTALRETVALLKISFHPFTLELKE